VTELLGGPVAKLGSDYYGNAVAVVRYNDFVM